MATHGFRNAESAVQVREGAPQNATVAQAEEHRICNAERAVSTTACSASSFPYSSKVEQLFGKEPIRVRVSMREPHISRVYSGFV